MRKRMCEFWEEYIITGVNTIACKCVILCMFLLCYMLTANDLHTFGMTDKAHDDLHSSRMISLTADDLHTSGMTDKANDDLHSSRMISLTEDDLHTYGMTSKAQ